MAIVYRHPTKADSNLITAVLNDSRRELPLHLDQTVQEVALRTFGNTDYNPEGYWLGVVDGDIAGYGGALIQKARTQAGFIEGWVSIEVIPEYRGKGIEQQLMQRSLNYLTSQKIKTAKKWCMGTKGWWHDLVLEFGFTDVRHEYLMMWKDKIIENNLPEGIHFIHILFKESSDEEVAHFVDVFNDAFLEHYNFSPATVERFIKSRDIERNVSRITFAKNGQQTAGVLMCAEDTEYNKENNTKIGWIEILGVIKEYRRRGIGRALLSDGVAWLHHRGMTTVYLEMDAENCSALTLYTSLGFTVEGENIIYEKELI
jgi:mycothiol synthase